jgi:hypothetical protein
MRAARFKLLLVALVFAAAGYGAAAQEAAEEFFEIPSDESALVIWLGSGWSLVSADEQATFDEVVAEESPLAIQYRVQPGTYQIFLDGRSEPISWDAEPGSLAQLWFGLFRPPANGMYSALQMGAIEATEPRHISLEGGVLYLSAEPTSGQQRHPDPWPPR